MPNRLEKANIRTFADDTTLFYSSNSLQDLEKTINEEFNHLLSYCSANKLSVNFKKTHYMTISSPQKNSPVFFFELMIAKHYLSRNLFPSFGYGKLINKCVFAVIWPYTWYMKVKI